MSDDKEKKSRNDSIYWGEGGMKGMQNMNDKSVAKDRDGVPPPSKDIFRSHQGRLDIRSKDKDGQGR